MIFPKKLPKGGTIGICSPAGPVRKERLDAAVQNLQSLGYHIVLSPSVVETIGLFAGTDAVRCAELEELFERKDIDAVFCSRGGVGSSRLLEMIDTRLIADSRKPFLGFSDTTAIQWWLWEKERFVTYTGPLAVEWDGAVHETSLNFALNMLNGEISGNLLALDSELKPVRMQGVGKVSGPLMAGNLTMITSLLGTPYMPDLSGAILLVEDVSEPPYRVDRLFFHLRNSGILEKISALIVGDFGFSNDPYAMSFLNTSVLEATRGQDYPIILNVPHGHDSDRVTLPIGADVILDADHLTLSLNLKATV